MNRRGVGFRPSRALLGLAVALGLAVLLAAGVTRGDTPMNGWDAVRDPAAAERFALHLRVREMMANVHSLPANPTLLRARALLEQAHADTSPDLRLRFDLGEIYAQLGNYVRATEVLRPALDLAPDHPAAVSAFIELTEAYARLDQSDEELHLYERFLPKITDERSRSTAMLNYAEAHMHLGDLESAISGYRATIDLAAQLPNMIELNYHTGALAVWGLAVALDRSGDIAAGAKETKLAVTLDHDMGIMRLDPAVFFSPEREKDWYVALGFTEYAKEAEDARAAATWWERAEGCWREYVEDVKAHTAQDRWVELARARFERAHAARLAAERKVKGRLTYPQYECVR